MRYYKTVTETKEVEKLVNTTCDICGNEKWDCNAWYGDVFSIDNTTIEMEQGEHYPECGHKTETNFDICTKCFKTKLIPWLKSQGAEPQEKESDW